MHLTNLCNPNLILANMDGWLHASNSLQTGLDLCAVAMRTVLTFIGGIICVELQTLITHALVGWSIHSVVTRVVCGFGQYARHMCCFLQALLTDLLLLSLVDCHVTAVLYRCRVHGNVVACMSPTPVYKTYTALGSPRDMVKQHRAHQLALCSRSVTR